MSKTSVVLMAVCISVFSLFSGKTYAAVKAAAAPSATLSNLLAAYNGEKNAQMRYMLFAQQADKEGYNGVASLFRAAARSEQVHYEGHAKAINELGGAPPAIKMATPVVKSTKENLEAAINGENYEFGKMYPEFLKQAEKDKVKSAIVSFKGALKIEGIHAQLFKKALKDMETWKGQKKDFFVCLVCGNVVENKPPMVCPICAAPREKFTAVN